MKKTYNLLVGIYFHPEAYPPTLNAIGELSDCFDQIMVIHRPHLENKWVYPANVAAIAAGKSISSVGQQNASFIAKIIFFLGYIRVFYRHCQKLHPSYVLVYDNISLLAYRVVKPFLFFEHKLWYHNHDVSELALLRKYSIGWLAARMENSAFKYLDIFSLPTGERKQYFPMQEFKGNYFVIPNYPAIKFYSRFYRPRELENTVKLIFQGQVGPLHGIEEIIPLLQQPVGGHNLELVLKGPCAEDFRLRVEEISRQNGVSNKVTFIGVTPYAEVPLAASRCHIGIGILAKMDIMNITLGTASNKLYEYAAVGLPVIYYQSENFTKHLGKFAWAFPAKLDTASIRGAIINILIRYRECSLAAHNDFLHELNFEKVFAPVKEYVALKKSGHLKSSGS